ncbi:MAG TPA: alpha/beta fold hydrolase [Propionibacteriaceae bacterium]
MELADRLKAFQRTYPYREIALDGVVWCYRMGGVQNASTVLLLPGATLVPDPFFIVIESLGGSYQVIAPAYPAVRSMAELVAGVTAILDAEGIPTAHVVGSSFGGYLAQCLVRAHPERVKMLVLAQTGVRHFIGLAPLTILRWLLQASPAPVVRWFMWRTWRVLLADLGPDRRFWTELLSTILRTELSKASLIAMMAAIADFTAHYRPTADRSGRRVLVLQSEQDRAFAAQADEIRAAYPNAVIRILRGAGHGALFTHTDQYVGEIKTFLATTGQRVAGPRGETIAAPGMATFDLSVAINRPPSVVFALLADIQNAVPQRAGVRMVKDPPRATTVGTHWHEDVRLAPGCWMHVETVVSDAAEPRQLGMDFWSRWFTGHLTYNLEPTADGTVLHQWETLRPRFFPRRLSPIIDRQLRPRLVQRLHDIKALLERSSSNPSRVEHERSMSVPDDVQRPTSSDVGRLGQVLRRLGIAGPVEYAFQVLHGLAHPHLLTSGATDLETRMPLPGDELVGDATLIRTRAHTVNASPQHVWAWVAQLGAGRAGWPGWYPFAHPHDPSPTRLSPDARPIVAGNVLLEVSGPESSACWHVVDVAPERHVVLHSCRTLDTGTDVRRTPGKRWADISWTFVLQPSGVDKTRLLARIRSTVSPRWYGWLMRPIVAGDTVMQRELLAAIARRAEDDRFERGSGDVTIADTHLPS